MITVKYDTHPNFHSDPLHHTLLGVHLISGGILIVLVFIQDHVIRSAGVQALSEQRSKPQTPSIPGRLEEIVTTASPTVPKAASKPNIQ